MAGRGVWEGGGAGEKMSDETWPEGAVQGPGRRAPSVKKGASVNSTGRRSGWFSRTREYTWSGFEKPHDKPCTCEPCLESLNGKHDFISSLFYFFSAVSSAEEKGVYFSLIFGDGSPVRNLRAIISHCYPFVYCESL